jgi:DNA replication protein DnaC
MCQKNVIILDDFLLTGVTFTQATYLFELLNYPKNSLKPRTIIICSQLMEEEMRLRLAEVSPSLAEAIMSRLKAKRLVLEISGKDMRLDSTNKETK